MTGILNEMFESLVVYIWKPFDEDEDHKAVLISAKDFQYVQELTGEYPSDYEYVVESFSDLLDVLWDREIPYQNLSNIIHYHIHELKEV
jgi:hypothetical protein